MTWHCSSIQPEGVLGGTHEETCTAPLVLKSESGASSLIKVLQKLVQEEEGTEPN